MRQLLPILANQYYQYKLPDKLATVIFAQTTQMANVVVVMAHDRHGYLLEINSYFKSHVKQMFVEHHLYPKSTDDVVPQ
jgi:hypothetical protein